MQVTRIQLNSNFLVGFIILLHLIIIRLHIIQPRFDFRISNPVQQGNQTNVTLLIINTSFHLGKKKRKKKRRTKWIRINRY